MSIAVDAFLRAALTEIQVARAGDVLSAEDQELALQVFNELLDAWNIDGHALYTRAFTSFTLTANLQPHTIGLAANTPTFTVTVGRPAAILSASIELATNINTPLTLRDDAWWAEQRAPSLTSNIPTDLNYRATWPKGSIYLWPVPTTAYDIELETETLLAQMLATDTLDLPFGYPQALRLTLAELLAPAFGQQVSQTTMTEARKARARVFTRNTVIPNAVTRDAGMPGGGGGWWDYRSGQVR